MEIWKDIPEFDGRYQISNFGRIKSIKHLRSTSAIKEMILVTQINRLGYERVRLFKNIRNISFSIHRLVAAAFISNPLKLREVNHKDSNKSNNNVANLEWATRSTNVKHAYDSGVKSKPQGLRNGRARLTEEQVLHIRKGEYSPTEYIKMYGVCRSTVNYIIAGKLWKHIA